MTNILLHALNCIALICTAVVFGTAVFFALVGKKAAAESKEPAILEIYGRFHEVADVRMPFFGVIGLLATITQIILYGIHDQAGQLAILALTGLLLQLFLYVKIAKPVNTIMVEAVKYGRVLNNVRELQQRWDSVIIWRAIALLLAMISLLMINYL